MTPPVPTVGGHETLNAPPSPGAGLTFELVYEHHFDFVWSMTCRFGVPAHALDDVVQEVFMVVHSKLSTLERPEALRSWLYGIVRRTVSGYRRKLRAAKTTQVDSVDDIPDNEFARSPADLAEQSDQVRRLWALLESIAPAKREVFVLAELEQFTCPEIAEALNIPLNTTYSRLRHAREEFELALSRQNLRKERIS